MFGSGRAILSLRDSYRRDLRDVKSATDFKYIRFHAIFHDEVGVYGEDSSGAPIYNFSYVDQIYDGLLQNGVRPFIELSFMPRKMAAQADFTILSGTNRSFRRPPAMRSGANSSPISRNTSSNATESTKSRSGILKSGTSRISTSGPAIRKNRPTTTSTMWLPSR